MPTTKHRPQFTTSAFVRSHCRRPSGRGSWAFQRSFSEMAFDRDLHGEVVFFNGTLTEAKALAAADERLAGANFVAVLP